MDILSIENMSNFQSGDFPLGQKTKPLSNIDFCVNLLCGSKKQEERFRNYLKRGGEDSKRIAEHACRYIYDLYSIKYFKDIKTLRQSYALFVYCFLDHDLVEGWPAVKSERDYLHLVRSVIRDPLSKCFMYGLNIYENVDPRIGFSIEDGKRTPIWVTVRKGRIENVEPGVTSRDVEDSSLTCLFYEIK